MSVKPTEILIEEHRMITRVLDATNQTLEAIDLGASFPDKLVERILDFFDVYANEYHTQREELLIPICRNHGMTEKGSSIGLVKQEHGMAHFRIKDAKDHLKAARKGDHEAQSHIRHRLEDYCVLLRNHIYMEDKYFFREVDLCLTRDDQKALLAELETMPSLGIDPKISEKYLKQIDPIEKAASELRAAV